MNQSLKKKKKKKMFIQFIVRLPTVAVYQILVDWRVDQVPMLVQLESSTNSSRGRLQLTRPTLLSTNLGRARSTKDEAYQKCECWPFSKSEANSYNEPKHTKSNQIKSLYRQVSIRLSVVHIEQQLFGTTIDSVTFVEQQHVHFENRPTIVLFLFY